MSRSPRRIHFLDELRGFCIVLMVFYHAFYTVGYVFGVSVVQTWFQFFLPSEPVFAGIFVFLCGICCNLSHSNLKRGLCLAGASVLLSLVLYAAVEASLLDSTSLIWFGILHCLAACILLYTLLRPTLRFIPAWLGFLLCLLLFAVSWHVPASEGGYLGFSGVFRWDIPIATANNPLLYAWGLCPVGITADYFPLFPWLFCFLAGSYLGVGYRRFPSWMYRRHVPFLSRIGKLSLWIYLGHQPLIYGLCTLVFSVLR